MTKPTLATEMAGEPGKGRILFVANTDWYLFNFRYNLIVTSEAAGWSPMLACPPAQYTERFREKGWPVIPVRMEARGLNPIHELRALTQLARVFYRTKPDVIHLFTLKCVLYGCLAAPFARRSRIVGGITGVGYLFTSTGWRARLLKRPVLWTMKLAISIARAQLIFQNESDRDEFVSLGVVPYASTVVIRGSGVDCEVFQPPDRPTMDSDRPLRLLFSARLISEKGIHHYLEATAELRKRGYRFQSRIAGAPYPGNPSSLSDAEVRDLANDKNHDYLGHCEDMPGLLAETDVVVLPTYYREGTPKSLLEAAASGCMIVTTDIPACAGIVDSGRNGYLVPIRQTAPLVSALEKIFLADSEERQAMRAASRNIAIERFSDIQVNAETAALYE